MWYWIFRAFFWALVKVLFKLKVEGLNNLPDKTNFIIVANHASYLDSLILGAALPERIYWIAANFLYRSGWLRWFFKKTDTLALGNASTQAFKLLEKGKNVGLFPEGKRSLTGNLNPFRTGAALLASKTGRPIVPCAILGAYQAYPPKARFPRVFVPVQVRLGKPIYVLREFDDIIDDTYLKESMLRVKREIENLLCQTKT